MGGWVATHDSVPLTFPGGEAGLEAGAAPGGLAPERVGADGSGSPSSRRSCGAPGTSGQCQARGLDPAGARRIFSPQACGFSLPGNGALPSPHDSFGGYGDLGKGKIKVLSPLGGEQELELPVPLTLKKGRKALTTSSLL